MKKVLVVEDDLDYSETIKEILMNEGFQVITENTGGNIVNLVKKECPCLVLLDIMLPVKTGDRIAKELKKNKDTKNTPVVMVSGNQDVKQVANKTGADDYLEKPFRLKELIFKVKKYSMVG